MCSIRTGDWSVYVDNSSSCALSVSGHIGQKKRKDLISVSPHNNVEIPPWLWNLSIYISTTVSLRVCVCVCAWQGLLCSSGAGDFSWWTPLSSELCRGEEMTTCTQPSNRRWRHIKTPHCWLTLSELKYVRFLIWQSEYVYKNTVNVW